MIRFDPDDELDLYSLPYRLTVGIVVFNKDGKVFLARRFASKNGTWQMLQGGIRDNETAREAGLRWLYEELNMIDLDFVFESNQWLYHDFNKFLAERLWDGQYRGQKQKWLLMRFYGKDSVIDASKSNADFAEWRWADLEEVPEVVIPSQKHIYTAVLEEFGATIKEFNKKS